MILERSGEESCGQSWLLYLKGSCDAFSCFPLVHLFLCMNTICKVSKLSLNRSPEITSLNVHVTMCHISINLMPLSTRINVNVSRVSCVAVHEKHLKSVTYKDEIQSGHPV